MNRPGERNRSDVPWSDTSRSIASALLMIHLICIALVLSANLSPSPLQARIVRTLAPYTRVFNWDPNFTRFHWTHGTPDHDDHRWVVERTAVAGGELAREPLGAGARGGLRRARHQAFADFAAFYALPEQESDDVTALLASRIGIREFSSSTPPHQLKVRIESWDPHVMGTPAAPGNWTSLYSAEVLSDGSVLKDAARGEVALPQRTAPPAGRTPVAPSTREPQLPNGDQVPAPVGLPTDQPLGADPAAPPQPAPDQEQAP